MEIFSIQLKKQLILIFLIMKNIFLTLALLLTLSFAFAGNNIEKNTKSNQISFVNRTKYRVSYMVQF